MHGGAFTTNEFQWGGAGDDTIYGGRSSSRQILNGNEGDDTIYPGSSNYGLATVNGGKGDDLINPWELTYDENDEVEQNPIIDQMANPNNTLYGTGHTLRGGEGNDKIWGPTNSSGEILIEGGNGDDSLYGAYGVPTYG